jgi:hypothetical protein
MFVLTILLASKKNCFYSSIMKPCAIALQFVNLDLKTCSISVITSMRCSLAIDQDSGYILRSFKRNLSSKSSLTPASINHILKSLQKQAGLNQIGELSGHSFRVVATLDLLNKNVPLEKIMLRGGWKSEASAMRYLQSWNDSNWLVIN